MASRLNPTNFGYQNFYSALLTSDITSGTLTISLDTVPTPTSGILVIDPNSATNREVILYTSKGASTIVCPSDGRGYSGTSAVAHLTGTQLIMAPIDKWFTALASGELSTDPLRTELFYDYVASGCVWTGDSLGSTKNGSMTSGVIYIAGRRLTLVAVTAHVFTASKDTYIDASDNGDGTALLTYTEVTNNAASPALASNNLRLGIVVTGASNIAAAGSINQGQENKVLPIASSVAYSVTDSLGNLICSRDPLRKTLALGQIVTNFTTTATSSDVTITGLQTTFQADGLHKVILKVFFPDISSSSASAQQMTSVLKEGSTLLQIKRFTSGGSNFRGDFGMEIEFTPTAGTHTYIATINATSAGTTTVSADPTFPAQVTVRQA